MRIDSRSTEPTFTNPNSSRAEGNESSTAFQSLLEHALSPPVTQQQERPLYLPATPLLPITSPLLDSETLTPQELKEQKEDQDEILEIREDSYEEDLLENQEAMEDVIENWKKTAEELEKESPAEIQEDRLEEEAAIDGEGDIELELLDDQIDINLETDPSPMDLKDESDQQGEKDQAQTARSKSQSNLQNTPLRSEEREMTYEEIQHLVDAVVHGSNSLPYKLHHLLRKVLDSLMSGNRYPLNQHTLMDLDITEWKTLFELFPARFFQGLIRPMLKRAGNDFKKIQNDYELLDNILYQRGLSLEQLDQLENLWGRLTSLPSLFTNWLRHPELPTLSLEELQHPLEILHQHQGMLPGATGRIQSLALQYLHHPETAVELLEISRNSLHGRPLSTEQIQLLSEKLADFCFSAQMHAGSQVSEVLNKALNGKDLSSEEILLILQGAPQKILSHLPFYCLPLALQEIIHFIHTDPDHSEDNILALFLENEGLT
jgi:hypothetical protein